MTWLFMALGILCIIVAFGIAAWASGDEPDHTDPWDDNL